MSHDSSIPSGFRKKVYTKLTTSKLSGQISSSIAQIPNSSERKIVPSRISLTMREELKKLFLPLLIDIFEINQATKNARSTLFSDSLLETGITGQSPEQTLKKLEALQSQIREAQNWCEGVMLQITKGIDDAQALIREMEKKAQETQQIVTKQNRFLQSLRALLVKVRERDDHEN